MLKKSLSLLLFFLICFFLVSCGDQQAEVSSLATDKPETVHDIRSEGNALVSALNSIKASYSSVPHKLRASGCHNIDAVIPEEKLTEAATHAKDCPVILSDGFYEFEYNSDEEHSYDVWGQNILDETCTAVPAPDEDGDGTMESVSGDLIVEGGGRFTRRYCYRIAGDASSGSSEMQSYLNGEFIGHERFDWQVSNNVLYFSDASLSRDDFDSWNEGFNYVIVFGMVSGKMLRLVEFNAVSEVAEIPREYMVPSSISERTLSSIKDYNVSISVEDGVATEMRDGRTFTYHLQ